MATEIYFIRHAESLDNQAGVAFDEMNIDDEGFLDNPLSELGLEQADAAADWLYDHVNADAVFSSGMTRTNMTAEPIAAKYGYEIEIMPELREVEVEVESISKIDIENTISRTLYKLPYGKEIRAGFFQAGVAVAFNVWALAGMKGFEDVEDLRARAKYCLETLAARPEKRIIAVAHNFFIGALLIELMDIYPGNTLKTPFPIGLLPNCSATCVIAHPPRFRLRYAARKTSDIT